LKNGKRRNDCKSRDGFSDCNLLACGRCGADEVFPESCKANGFAVVARPDGALYIAYAEWRASAPEGTNQRYDEADTAAPLIEATVSMKAAGGRFNFLKKTLPCDNGRFSTEISFSQLTPEVPWESTVQVILRNEGERPAPARFNLSTKATSTDYLYAKFDVGRGGAFVRLADLLHVGEPVQIAVTWLDSKTVAATMGKEQAHFTLQDPVDELELVISGGAATFANNALECTKK
jgi:hypothetical protein